MSAIFPLISTFSSASITSHMEDELVLNTSAWLMECMTCFELGEGSCLSDPIKTRCCVTPKKCVYKEDVFADIWTKHLLCSLDIPDSRLLHVLFGLRTKEDVIRF